jgi:hypothetical protein
MFCIALQRKNTNFSLILTFFVTKIMMTRLDCITEVIKPIYEPKRICAFD